MKGSETWPHQDLPNGQGVSCDTSAPPTLDVGYIFSYLPGPTTSQPLLKLLVLCPWPKNDQLVPVSLPKAPLSPALRSLIVHLCSLPVHCNCCTRTAAVFNQACGQMTKLLYCSSLYYIGHFMYQYGQFYVLLHPFYIGWFLCTE